MEWTDSQPVEFSPIARLPSFNSPEPSALALVRGTAKSNLLIHDISESEEEFDESSLFQDNDTIQILSEDECLMSPNPKKASRIEMVKAEVQEAHAAEGMPEPGIPTSVETAPETQEATPIPEDSQQLTMPEAPSLASPLKPAQVIPHSLGDPPATEQPNGVIPRNETQEALEADAAAQAAEDAAQEVRSEEEALHEDSTKETKGSNMVPWQLVVDSDCNYVQNIS